MPDELIGSKPDEGGAVRGSWTSRLASMPNDSTAKTLTVAFLVALVASILVSASAALLQPRINANIERERERNLLEIVQRLPGIEDLFDRVEDIAVEAYVVDLATGAIDQNLHPGEVDPVAMAQDPEYSIVIPSDRDIAGLRRISRYEIVHLVRADNQLRLIVLPVRGQGFASTLYGYLGLAGDGNSVVGLSFYQHGETPGLGAQVDNPQWRGQWQGKRVRDPQGQLRIGVARSTVAPTDPNAPYQVEGLSGATFTSQGVNNLVRFWLGDDGFGPFLDRIRQR